MPRCSTRPRSRKLPRRPWPGPGPLVATAAAVAAAVHRAVALVQLATVPTALSPGLLGSRAAAFHTSLRQGVALRYAFAGRRPQPPRCHALPPASSWAAAAVAAAPHSEDAPMLAIALRRSFAGLLLGGTGGALGALERFVEQAAAAYDAGLPRRPQLQLELDLVADLFPKGDGILGARLTGSDLRYLGVWLDIVYCTLSHLKRFPGASSPLEKTSLPKNEEDEGGGYQSSVEMPRDDPLAAGVEPSVSHLVDHVLQNPTAWSTAERSRLSSALQGRETLQPAFLSLPQLVVLVATKCSDGRLS